VCDPCRSGADADPLDDAQDPRHAIGEHYVASSLSKPRRTIDTPPSPHSNDPPVKRLPLTDVQKHDLVAAQVLALYRSQIE
jgi:hypothetical protein